MWTNNALHIQKAGIHTCIQDLGRTGYLAFGVARSGAMDHYSAWLANKILENPPEAALLETTMQGLSIHFESNCQIAVTGGDLGAMLNHQPLRRYQTVNIHAGDEVNFTRLKSGFRAYLAVSGGIKSKPVMGSCASNAAVDLGVTRISDGTRLHFHHVGEEAPETRIPDALVPLYARHFTARVIPGPEYDLFDVESIRHFTSHPFRISSESNRMGYRLERTGPPIIAPAGILSSGVVPGTIQVPASGQPIILMNDGPVTGGYPRIANVITQDLDHIAQQGPGSTLRFKWVSLEEAEQLWKTSMEVQKAI